MRHTRSYVLLIAAIALLLAACSSPQALQSSDEVIIPAKGGNLSVAALPAWSNDDNLTVEVLGVGLGNSNDATDTATFVIPDPSNVVKVYVQVVTKAGTSGEGTYPDPTEVEIQALDAANTVIAVKSLSGGTVERVGIQSQTGVGGNIGSSGTTGYSHEAEFSAQVASVAIDISDNAITGFPASPRALIVSVFRDLDDDSSSAGLLPNLYVFGDDGYPDAAQTIALPAAFAGGDVTVTFAISDVEMFSRSSGFTENDPRIVYYAASAGGASADAKLDKPNMGADLAIVELVLNDVPAGTTEVQASLYSPAPEDENPKGDSVYWNTVSVKVNAPENEVDFEGCTPGYWRQEHHFDSWTTYSPEQLFSTVFGVDPAITVKTGGRSSATDPTLLQAVWANGGDINALARHATAALLNAASADVDYTYSEAEVIAMVKAAIASGVYEKAKDILAAANEIGCDLN